LDSLNDNKEQTEDCHTKILDKKEEMKHHFEEQKKGLESAFNKIEELI